MEDVLAEAHEPKRARLDHAGMDRPDRDLVNFLALDPVERVRVHRARRRALEPDRLEPRVTGDAHPVLLVELALEAMERGQLGRQLVIADGRIDAGPRDVEPVTVLEHGGDQHALAIATRHRASAGAARPHARDQRRRARPPTSSGSIASTRSRWTKHRGVTARPPASARRGSSAS